ncbi:MAG: hypothetical protein EBR82_41965 [Caulobacteraceae bacterium]|nr:hypothetical protein [Caulobacteraceae bacterium]
MTLLSLLLLAQAIVQAPAVSPASPAFPPADTTKLSLVLVQTVSETDPQPLCPQPNCTSMFLGRYKDAVVLAGPALPAEFTARIEMGSPWNKPYRLALIVEQRDGQEPLVRAETGFNVRTGEGCFEFKQTGPLNWHPTGEGFYWQRQVLCLKDPTFTPVMLRP